MIEAFVLGQGEAALHGAQMVAAVGGEVDLFGQLREGEAAEAVGAERVGHAPVEEEAAGPRSGHKAGGGEGGEVLPGGAGHAQDGAGGGAETVVVAAHAQLKIEQPGAPGRSRKRSASTTSLENILRSAMISSFLRKRRDSCIFQAKRIVGRLRHHVSCQV